MKNKSVLCLLFAAVFSISAFFISACGKGDNDEKNAEIYAVYQIYVSAETEQGKTPLSYEKWLNSLKGAKGENGDSGNNGVGIVKIEKTNTDGANDTYTVFFSDGTTSTFIIVNGKNGEKGATGDNGNNGIDGKSAYEIWLDAGNSGTEEDFLNSLKGASGDNGTDGKSAYEIWLSAGNSCTEEDFLNSLKGASGTNGNNGNNGIDGKSAYEIWLDAGNSGTEEEFLNSLKGASGADVLLRINDNNKWEVSFDGGNTYEELNVIATGASGENGTDGNNGVNGNDGLDGVAPRLRINETNNEWEVSYDEGKSWVSLGVNAAGANGTDGNSGADGKSAYEIWLSAGNSGTEEEFLNSLKGENGVDVLLRINDNNKWEVSFDGGNIYEELNVIATGASGENGTDGNNGANGNDGVDGVAPRLRINETNNKWEVSYDEGKSWVSLGVNATGANGANGTDGNSGADGKSAYEIWLNVGNSGTEEDFLNYLKGANGADGVIVKSITVDYDGHLYVALTNDKIIDAGRFKDAHPHVVIEKEIIKTEPTCANVGVKYIVCETCGEVIKTIISDKLPHDYASETYVFDDHFHWRETNCMHDEPVDKGEHQLVGGVCSVCSYNVKSTAALIYQAIKDDTEYAVVGFDDDTLETVYIPASYNGKPVTKISVDAFKDHGNIKTLILGANITEIEEGAFSGCAGLFNVYYEGSASKWKKVNISDNNYALVNAVVYSYLSYQPTFEGLFWHYASDNFTPIIWEYGDWTVSY